MRSTMMDTPLQVARLLEHGRAVHNRSEVITWTGGGSVRKTFAEIGVEASRLANALRDELHVTGDQAVATLMWNNGSHMAAYLAVPSMGAVLHTLNPRLFPEQLAYIVNHAEDHTILVDSTLVPVLARILPDLKTVQHVVVVGGGDATPLTGHGAAVHSYDELLAGRSEVVDWAQVDELDAAALCYTSGTTGNPKGVAYSHRSIYLHSMQVCAAEAFCLAPKSKALVVVPMFHAMGWGLPYAAFMSGASLLMPDRFLQGGPLAEMIAAERPTLAGAVPTIWSDLLNTLETNPVDLTSMKEVIVGGSACPPALMHAFSEKHGVELIHAWGMTETSPLGSVARPPARATGDHIWKYRYTQGRIPASVEARITGPDGTLLPSDGSSVGELEVRGPWISGTYVGDPEPDPEKFRDGWLRTGDVGTLSGNGFIALSDRAKDVIKSGGEWISSVDLENALMAHPAVLEACVVGVPDERWGERPFATVVLRDGATATVQDLRDHLAASIAGWQLPERWAFIDSVPKTSVGKFDKKTVRSSYAENTFDVLSVTP